ncbi:hypothetical protein B8W99_15680 [Peribacillus simplex]|nr:hypothetical protein B8W99_15680 [Peribacillus simplex]
MHLNFKQRLIGTEGTRLRGKSASKGDPTGAKSAEEAPGPHAESECLKWKSTLIFYNPSKKCRPSIFVSSLSKV